MYNTPVGIRVLEGAERRLFVESLATLVEQLVAGDDSYVSGPLSGLQGNQKTAVVHTVARALLCEEESAPKLTAVIEAAVATILDRARDMLALEMLGDIDPWDGPFGRQLSWRELVLAAGRETGISADMAEFNENDPDDWDLLLDCLEDRLLWDRDWEMEEHLDADPATSHRVKQELGIDEDYFVAVPPDPSEEECGRLLDELRELTQHGG
jgi:hypothetical protein